MGDWKTYVKEGYITFDCVECGAEDVEDHSAEIYGEQATALCPECGEEQEVAR